MPPKPRHHTLVIAAIFSMSDRPFSGFEVSRRTGVPRTTVTRIMSKLQAMGLLTYRPNYGRATWITTAAWPPTIEQTIDLYLAHLTLDSARPGAVYCRGAHERPRAS